MGRLKLRETRPSTGSNKRGTIWKTLTNLNIHIQRLFSNGPLHTILADDSTIEELTKKENKTAFSKEGLEIMDPELNAKKTLIIKQVDDHIHEKSPEDIKTKIERLNPVKVNTVIKLPNTRTIIKVKGVQGCRGVQFDTTQGYGMGATDPKVNTG
ncbi:uncharacterized protein LOC143033360 [Oratosquilla oratoria]|uniref:uncharacterized protein LOC143033360 n=1 Tax=Oratosquilla oratoria TaxID=337810 RepID=UPI003F758A7F